MYATRPDMTLRGHAGEPCPMHLQRLACSRSPVAPTNTPVSVPRSVPGSMPARSNASHDVSSSSRCCGSIASASRGEMPKKPGSNSAAS